MVFDFDITLFLFVFMRMSGCILFNPIFGRKNVPMILKIGLTFFLSIFTYGLIPAQTVDVSNIFVFMVLMIKELLVGLIVGFIIQLFMSAILIAGETIDFQMGFSMAKAYDPASNTSMPITGSIFNAMFMIIFFATNSHLTLIKIFCTLGTVAPFGQIEFSTKVFSELISLFSYILVYAVKMSMPILAVEIIAEIGVGLIMRAVPQINIFVINLQLKIFLGLACIIILIPAYSKFLELLITLMFDKINAIFGL